jgi:hypothetical protein
MTVGPPLAIVVYLEAYQQRQQPDDCSEQSHAGDGELRPVSLKGHALPLQANPSLS